MKSDVIRKRSQHDTRRSSQCGLDDLPPSPGFSHRTSLPRDTSPTLAPDSTTQMSYNSDDAMEFRSTSSELVGALGKPTSKALFNATWGGNSPCRVLWAFLTRREGETLHVASVGFIQRGVRGKPLHVVSVGFSI